MNREEFWADFKVFFGMNNKECLYWGNCGVKLITESEGATQCNNQLNCSLMMALNIKHFPNSFLQGPP